MIERLQIKNFKSIKELELDCRRVNVFIGEPDTGKSNILEALGLLSWCGHGYDAGKQDHPLMVSDYLSPSPATFDYGKFDRNTYGGMRRKSGLEHYVRFQNIENLFNDNTRAQPITISLNNADKNISVHLSVEQEQYTFSASIQHLEKESVEVISTTDSSGDLTGEQKKIPSLDPIRFYRFKDITEFSDPRSAFLMPPYGQNMFAVVTRHEKLKKTMQNFFSGRKFKFVINQSEKRFGFQEEENGVVTSYPYIISSDTLRHIVFFALAIESNKDATLVFEEPESHAFPYYTKWLGERIALYSNNQFFIATHNPYLLSALVEKTKIRDLNVVVTYMQDYQTKTITLTDDQIGEIMVEEPFFNLSRYIPGERA
ncbi:MAG: ATP/GTP-binding protein [Methanoregula sp.]|jgi:hypothetical protein